MKVRAKSIDKIGEYISFQYVAMPKFGMKGQSLVRELGDPIPLVLIAFKDQFAIGPITDLEPVWDDTIEIDTVADLAEAEAQKEEEIAKLLVPIQEPEKIKLVDEGEGSVEKGTTDADSGSGENASE